MKTQRLRWLMTRWPLWAVLLCCTSLLAPMGAAGAEERPKVGLDFWHQDYFSGDAIFVDVTRTFRTWYGDKVGRDSASTDQGIPLRDATALSWLRGYPGGIYKLRYEGSGEVTFGGLGEIVPGSVRKEASVTYADVKVEQPRQRWLAFDQEGNVLDLYLRNVDPNDPVRNVRLICPGYDVDTDRVVRDEFIRRVRPFSAFRFLLWSGIHTIAHRSAIGSWAERRKPDHFLQTSWDRNIPIGGTSWELMIDICNEAEKDFWLNIPARVDDEYIRQLARLIHGRQSPGRKCIVELDWELFQGGWPRKGPGSLAKLMNVDRPDPSNPEKFYYDAVAPRLVFISDTFRKQWRDRPGQVEIVVAGSYRNVKTIEQALKYFTDNGRKPTDVVDAIAIDGVFTTARRGSRETDLDKLMTRLLDMSEEEKNIRAYGTLAQESGLKLYAYGGGQLVWWQQACSTAMIHTAQNDPRMRQAYLKLFKIWRDAGGDLLMHHTFTGDAWGLLPDMSRPGSLKWDTMMGLLCTAGDATLDDAVDQKDLAVLEANYGQADRWWEHGDFNADNRVDCEDLLLLYKNFDSADVSARKQLDDFAKEHEIELPKYVPFQETCDTNPTRERGGNVEKRRSSLAFLDVAQFSPTKRKEHGCFVPKVPRHISPGGHRREAFVGPACTKQRDFVVLKGHNNFAVSAVCAALSGLETRLASHTQGVAWAGIWLPLRGEKTWPGRPSGQPGASISATPALRPTKGCLST